ncbi:HipA domain-containing protein [Alkalicoccobacillus porphyridii]|uniref:Toxin HipA n=1 Tax=Alkalicoccobacillus porphyridii TaxID=2597270 RepID=A0A554A1W7_9BACI|nr:HipA domain-containing protein [Alkalicoccobacillus porphyridii]TSB47691.1 toxin HipA [Alkalicoccobacillus porphyridii]
MHSVVDISNWEEDWIKQVSGTREKVWVKEPNNNGSLLFKIPKSTSNENWAELVSSEIGKMLGLDIMNVRLAINNGQKGVLLDNIQPARAIMEDGGELIKGVIEEFDPLSLDHYTIENIINSVEKFNIIHEVISMCLFDALIANQDRHCENWAVIRDEDNKVVFAPLYDNGAALGFNSNKETMKEMLRDSNRFQAFTNRSKTLIEVNGKRKPKMSMLLSYLKDMYHHKYTKELKRFCGIKRGDLVNIVNEVPDDWMSHIEKDWVCSLISYRSQWLQTI